MSRFFNLFLFIILVATGILWLIDILFLRGRKSLLKIKFSKSNILYRKLLCLIDHSISVFPVLLVVFLFRSFVFEPFRIPSESMLPTLKPGDLIVVNKHSYNIKLPFLSRDILSLDKPKRGDVIVFHYPYSKKVDYIKRIIGLPGDKISYQNKQLFINNVRLDNSIDGFYYDHESMSFINKYNESIDNVVYKILLNKGCSNNISPYFKFPFFENFEYFDGNFSCIVPDDNYFVMGDNRDNSFDSRYWGFVPYHDIVGKAFFIWMNFNDISRIGYLN